MFGENDKKHLMNLMEMVQKNLELNKMDYLDVSKVYHAFQWIQSLETKIQSAIENQMVLETLDYEIKQREEKLLDEIKMLEDEIKELKKPKRKSTKKRK